MTTKQAVAIVNTMTRNLDNKGLAEAVLAALGAAKMPANDKNVADVTNEYRQHQWDVEDLTGPTAAKPTTKAAVKKPITKALAAGVKAAKIINKKAAKATTKPAKAAAKKEPKGKSRVARMFELVLEGKTNEAALAAIVKEYGKGDNGKITTTASIGWCRSQLKANSSYAKKHNPKGLKVLSNIEAAAKTGK